MCTLYKSETVRARASLKECNTENSNPHGFQQNRHTIQDTTKLLCKVIKAIITIKTKANPSKSPLLESAKRARTYLPFQIHTTQGVSGLWWGCWPGRVGHDRSAGEH